MGHTPVAFYADELLGRKPSSSGRNPASPRSNQLGKSLVYEITELLEPLREQTERQLSKVKSVSYCSNEFLLGPLLASSLYALRNKPQVQRIYNKYGKDLAHILENEHDPGLGNGGLGRLAACYLDSAANMHLPVMGYGLLFENGFMNQKLDGIGRQIDLADEWLENELSWARRTTLRMNAHLTPMTVRFRHNIDVPVCAHDIPIPSRDGTVVNTLRLFEPLYVGNAGELKDTLRKINDRLYPPADDDDGRKLRLAQEMFLVSAMVQDTVRRHLINNPTVDNLADMTSLQINDTHPALAVPELIRVLVDEHDIKMDRAIDITRKVCNYTNHTLASEALEKWHTGLASYLLPRHYEIIFDLHERWLHKIDAKIPKEEIDDAKTRCSIIKYYKEGDPEAEAGGGNYVRMGHLTSFYSNKVNGVSALHSTLVDGVLFPDRKRLIDQGNICNVTNGITPRRWVEIANPGLAELFTRTSGSEAWTTDLKSLDEKLETVQDKPSLIREVSEIKRENKKRLAEYIERGLGLTLNPNALFDVQVKRKHEYKRQFLNLIHTVALYQDILYNPDKKRPPIVKIFAGLAAPKYKFANDCITLTNWLAGRINNDPRVGDKLKIQFIPGYKVSVGQKIIPAADLSEQISLAGWEASGTSNMKFTLNGALTIGTLDGANIEIREKAGAENFFSFGMTKDEVESLRRQNLSPQAYRERFILGEENTRLRNALAGLGRELNGDWDSNLSRLAYMPWNVLDGHDRWLIAADFNSYWETQEKAHELYLSPDAWTKVAIRNIRAGTHFSSDRSVMEYASNIWDIKPMPSFEPEPSEPARYSCRPQRALRLAI